MSKMFIKVRKYPCKNCNGWAERLFIHTYQKDFLTGWYCPKCELTERINENYLNLLKRKEKINIFRR